MGSVNNVLFSMFPNYASQVMGGSTTPSASAASSGYGDAVELSLSQEQSSNGDTYDLSLYGYSPDTGNQVISDSANGATPQGAFQTLMSTLSGLGDENQPGTAAGYLLGQFNELDGELTPGTGTGAVSTTTGFENTPAGLQSSNSASVTANISSTGQVTGADVHTTSTPLTSEQMQQQFQTSIASLLHNPVSQMTDSQSLTYIGTVIRSIEGAQR